MKTSSYPKVLVFAVIVAFSCGMVTAAPMFSPSSSEINSLIITNPELQNILNKEYFVSHYKKVSDDALYIIYGNTPKKDLSSGFSGLGSEFFDRHPFLRTRPGAEFDSQVGKIIDSAVLQLSDEAECVMNAGKYLASQPIENLDICDDMTGNLNVLIEQKMTTALKLVEVQIIAELINLFMNSGDMIKASLEALAEQFACDLITKYNIVGDLITKYNMPQEELALKCQTSVPALVNEFNQSEYNIHYTNPAEARKLLEEHFALNRIIRK